LSRLRFLHVAIACALLALIVWKTGVNDVRHVLSDVDPWLLAAVAALNVPIALLFPLRSHFVLRRMGARVDPRVLVPAAILGNVAGSLTPASAGELLRTAALRSHANLPVEDGLALVVYERALSLWIMGVTAGIAAGFIALDTPVATAIAAGGLAFLALPSCGPWLLGVLPSVADTDTASGWRSWIRRLIRAAGRLQWLLGDRWLLVGWSFITAVLFAITTLQLWLLTRAVSHSITPAEAWTAYGASQLAGIVSLLPLGLGAADGSLAALLRRMGTTLEQGTVVAILVRATMTLPLGLMAVASYVYLARGGGRGDQGSGEGERAADGGRAPATSS
jgi:uncharacterized membrane protein YbhN (UPF0104 family)